MAQFIRSDLNPWAKAGQEVNGGILRPAVQNGRSGFEVYIAPSASTPVSTRPAIMDPTPANAMPDAVPFIQPPAPSGFAWDPTPPPAVTLPTPPPLAQPVSQAPVPPPLVPETVMPVQSAFLPSMQDDIPAEKVAVGITPPAPPGDLTPLETVGREISRTGSGLLGMDPTRTISDQIGESATGGNFLPRIADTAVGGHFTESFQYGNQLRTGAMVGTVGLTLPYPPPTLLRHIKKQCRRR